MNSDQIFDVIRDIADVSGRKEKEAILLTNKSELLEKVLSLAYDPFVLFHTTVSIEQEKQSRNIRERLYGGPTVGRTFSLSSRDGENRVFNLLEALIDGSLVGNAAKNGIDGVLPLLTEKSAALLACIINKDVRCGISTSTINNVFPNLIPEFNCMLAQKFDVSRIKRWPVVVEPKLDGVRVLAFVVGGQVRFYSRSGKEFTVFDHLKAPLLRLAGASSANMSKPEETVFDGEVISGSFNKTIRSVRKQNQQAEDAVFNVFDVIDYDKWVSGGIAGSFSYQYRRALLENSFEASGISGGSVVLVPRYFANSEEEITDLYDSVRKRGLEGLIVKSIDSIYEQKRSWSWMKIKNASSLDLLVVNFVEGEGKYEGMLGALVVDHGGVLVNVGTGLSDVQRIEFWNNRHALVGRIVEVTFHELTEDGSLRHPRFIRFRDSIEHGVKE